MIWVAYVFPKCLPFDLWVYSSPHGSVFLFCFNVVESVSLLSFLVLSHPQQSLCHCLGADGYTAVGYWNSCGTWKEFGDLFVEWINTGKNKEWCITSGTKGPWRIVLFFLASQMQCPWEAPGFSGPLVSSFMGQALGDVASILFAVHCGSI